MLSRLWVAAVWSCVVVVFGVVPVLAEDIAAFYKNKTITLVISTGVGGGYDLTARTIARYLPKYIPGNPAVVPKNMPGAGNVLAANYIYSVAPKDGTAIATIGQAAFLLQPLGDPGVRFDAQRFYYLGSASADNSTIYAWHTTGIRAIADVYQRELVLGATGAGSGTTVYPIAMNNLLGTKFTIVAGYRTSREVDLAMARGEVGGRAGNNFQSLKTNHPDWVRDGKVVFLVQIGLERNREFAKVPLLTELAKTDEQRQIFRMFSAPVAIGRPFLTTPGVPTERAAALRKAFDAVMADPQFRAEGEKLKLDISPTSGPQLARIISELVNTPPEIVARARKVSR
jgi:tripartite-type tricarboxylate transporter receptor subunit TctC